MVLVRFRSDSDARDTLKKLKKMHKFTKELIECFEEKIEDDDDEDYRYDDEYDEEEIHHRRGGSAGGSRRYRRGM